MTATLPVFQRGWNLPGDLAVDFRRLRSGLHTILRRCLRQTPELNVRTGKINHGRDGIHGMRT